jgi:hypothetical protein
MYRDVERLSTARHEAELAARVPAAVVEIAVAEIIDAEAVDVTEDAIKKVRMTKEAPYYTNTPPSTWSKQISLINSFPPSQMITPTLRILVVPRARCHRLLHPRTQKEVKTVERMVLVSRRTTPNRPSRRIKELYLCRSW